MPDLVPQAEDLLLVGLLGIEVDEVPFFVLEGHGSGDGEVFHDSDFGLLCQFFECGDSERLLIKGWVPLLNQFYPVIQKHIYYIFAIIILTMAGLR